MNPTQAYYGNQLDESNHLSSFSMESMTSSVYGTRTESFFGAARKPSPPRQMGLPYMEEHRILRKRNKVRT